MLMYGDSLLEEIVDSVWVNRQIDLLWKNKDNGIVREFLFPNSFDEK